VNGATSGLTSAAPWLDHGDVRVIATKESVTIGRCIYCGTAEGKLSEEHVTPFGLGGKLTLSHASCTRCRDITSRFEGVVQRNMFFAARAAMASPTRRPEERERRQRIRVERNGAIEDVEAVWQDQWKLIELPIFPTPAHIDGRSYGAGIEVISKDTFELIERGVEVARRHGAEKMVPRDYKAEDFARFIAKMGYGYAVAAYGLDLFVDGIGRPSSYVLPALLGERDDIGRWVGCSDRRELPVRKCNVSVAYGVIRGVVAWERELIVKLKMFPLFDGAEYVVVIGKVPLATQVPSY
jgi:hypothetical protein